MELIKAIVLGIIQGLSEFLPISSSGHLVIFSDLLKFADKGLAFDVFVHFGTLVAVVVVFWRDIWRMVVTLPGIPALLARKMEITSEDDQHRALAVFIIVGSIPAAVIGILFEDTIEQVFHSPVFALSMLLVTAAILWSSRYPRERQEFMTTRQALGIGFAQAFAIIPGISRSGSTIVTGLWMGINRELAARFSFLMSVPVIFGATLLKFKDLLHSPPPASQIVNLIGGTLAAALSGYFAIIWLLDIVKKKRLEYFAYYCAAVGIIGLVAYWMVG